MNYKIVSKSVDYPLRSLLSMLIIYLNTSCKIKLFLEITIFKKILSYKFSNISLLSSYGNVLGVLALIFPRLPVDSVTFIIALSSGASTIIMPSYSPNVKYSLINLHPPFSIQI